MDSTLSAELQQRLAELQEAFRQQLPGKIGEIQRGWQKLSSDWSAEPLSQLHRMCHSLAGSGGTFGAHEIGQAARTLEQQLKALAAEGGGPDTAAHQQLDELVNALVRAVEDWTLTRAPRVADEPKEELPAAHTASLEATDTIRKHSKTLPEKKRGQ